MWYSEIYFSGILFTNVFDVAFVRNHFICTRNGRLINFFSEINFPNILHIRYEKSNLERGKLEYFLVKWSDIVLE